MRTSCSLVVVPLCLLLGPLASHAFVDEENEAVVIEAARGSNARSGKQLFQSGSYPIMPASTQLLTSGSVAPALCQSSDGSYSWCNYQVPAGWPGVGGGAWGGYPGVGVGGWPGVGSYPGVVGSYPGAGGSYPGAGGSYPGAGGSYPGAGGSYPGVAPGWPGVGVGAPGAGGFPGGAPGGGGFPGGAPGGGGFPGGAPGGGAPGGGGFPGGAPGGGAPGGGGFPGGAPGGGAPPPRPPPDNGDGVDTIGGDNPSAPSQPSVGCGAGKYSPIIYKFDNGTTAEEWERMVGEYPFRVVNGWPADKGEWPWIAALLNNGRQFCGGSLIDSQHVMTAAHCVAHMSRYDVANLRVRLGDYNIKQAGETETFETKASRVVRHKTFSQQTLHKDIAIITLEEPVPASMSHIRPVCLPTGHDTYDGHTATVIGWGSLRENGPQPDILQEITVKIWNNGVCKETYGDAAPGGIEEHMLCAGQQGKDSCSGDSGGPMQIGTGNSWTQIGIVSWGIGCGKSHYPGVYTRVTEMRSWIDKILGQY